MKKQILFLTIAIFTIYYSNAQLKGTNWLKAGVNFGIPIADTANSSNFVAGIDLKYQFLGINSFGFGVATGYSNYFGKKNLKTSEKYSDFSFIPVAGLLRYYVTNRFFMGGDVGYAFSTAKNTSNGFYYRPEIGYHNKAWNIYAFYQGVSLEKTSPASIGIGINYNIIQGK